MDTFSIHFHYGEFVDKKKLKYVGGDDALMADIDVDKVSFFRIVDLTEEAGTNLWKTLYYVEPTLGLRKGLRKVKSDSDVLQMVAALDENRCIHMYVDHQGIDISGHEGNDESSDSSEFDDESFDSSKSDDGPQVGEAGDQINVDEATVAEAGSLIRIPIPSISASISNENLSAVESDDTLHEANTGESSNNSLQICLGDTFSSLVEIKKKNLQLCCD